MSEDPKDFVEEGVVSLYRGLYRLRQAGKVQEEYDNMGTVVDMLTKDREHMRVKFKGQITI